MTHLTAIILTRNEATHIEECLQTLTFVDERIVFDSGSTDDTIEIARAAGARVLRHSFENFAAQRNAALDAVRDDADWVLFVDADERVTPDLAEEILRVIVHPEHQTYAIPRRNYLFGKLTTGAGWYPDYQTRLLKVGHAHYERAVHEIVVTQGSEGKLTSHLVHYNYNTVEQFHEKQRKYLRYDAGLLYQQGIQPKPYTYLTQPLRHFWWRFIELNGYKDGFHGLRLSVFMAWYEFQKYWLLREMLETEQRPADVDIDAPQES